MGRLLQIAALGCPVLRRRAEEVKDPLSKDVQGLIDDMFATVAAAKGVGLAAPQVYESQRIFVMSSRPNSRYPDAPDLGPLALMNPEILSVSDEIEKGWEGCLSIPGIRALVPRHKALRVRFSTKEGELKELELSGFPARIFQHEFDHLEGLVIFDRVEDPKDIIMESEWVRLVTENG